MSDEEKEVIEKVRELIKHKDDHIFAFGTKIYEPYAMSKEDYEPIERLLNMIDRHYLIDDTKCLRCGEGIPAYCEDCMQKVIAENAELQRYFNKKCED